MITTEGFAALIALARYGDATHAHFNARDGKCWCGWTPGPKVGRSQINRAVNAHARAKIAQAELDFDRALASVAA